MKLRRLNNGLDAVRILTGEQAPELAVLDWMMPGADGLSVCRQVRERSASYVYLLLFTARDGDRDLIEALDAGADDFVTKPLNISEMQARLRSGQRILDLQERLLQATERLRLESARDQLTGLWNRTMILDLLHRELRRARQEGHLLSVVLADIDYFKKVNDTYGHAAGDAVLRITAGQMASVLRDYDFLGRFGGEEFLIVLPKCDPEKAIEVANRLRAAVSSQPVEVRDGQQITVTMSLGTACAVNCEVDAAALIAAADLALYDAKEQGRNRSVQGNTLR
jgi:diguanylate cyclase (GGDEF)-like protein